MVSVNCVIVTYNRIVLLKECIGAVLEQTVPVKKIFIVNNASTDGTGEYLASLTVSNIEIINLPENTGGAGGFNTGLKRSVEASADWAWLMDDDTIPSPTALEKLVQKSGVVPKTGFLYSRVLYIDETVHKMNSHCPEKFLHGIAYSQYIDQGIILIKSCSFVSCLINQDVIRQVGYPIADFFIWCDDLEYSQRIIKTGYFGVFVPESTVIHKTAQNYDPSIKYAPREEFWKFFYGQRNEVYLLRREEPAVKFVYLYIKQTLKKIVQCLYNKNGRFKLLLIILRGRFLGLFFNPRKG